jgi:hypothetical protein
MMRSKNIQLVLDILKDEVSGNGAAALSKMAHDYSMTWMYKRGEVLFPVTRSDFKSELSDAYEIKGRKYEIKNIAEGDGVVMIELIESYPDPETKRMYRTPLVIVLEIEVGKIKTGRHYCDPDISSSNLRPDDMEKAFLRTETKLVIE